MDDLLAEFIAESRDMLEALSGEIVAWEADPADRARLDAIFRFVHTVKGNCGFFDFPRLEALSHAAEDALADVRAGRRQPDGPLVSAVLGIIDRIAEMIAAIDCGEDFPAGDDSALIEALEPGAEGVFVRVSDSDPEMLRYLAERGIAPGDELSVEDKQPFGGPLFVRFRGEVHVLGGALAGAMRVRTVARA